jgi:GPH family glycoside/pentoside/hexuronide:cation symporter
MGVQNFIGQLAYLLSPWFLWFMTQERWFADQLTGARALALLVGLTAMALGVVPALALRERFAAAPAPAPASAAATRLAAHLGDFARGLRTTLRSGPFLLLGAATFLVFNGFILISSFQSYVVIYYVFGGDQARGATYAGYSGTLGAVSTFAVISLVTYLATRIGKKRAFYAAIGISILGYLIKWPCYDPARPWLMLVPAPLMAFGLGGLFTLMGSMMADVVDEDELHTHERREGMFGSIFWWVVKLGMALALAAGGYLLNWTGFDVALGGSQSAAALWWMRLCDVLVPAATSALALFAVWRYPITEERARQTRATLEARRGRSP